MGLELYNSKLENKLIKACVEKDGRAQRELYEKYSARMYPICMRYVRDADIAQDILVIGFTKVFDKISSYTGQGSLVGWIRKIMINEALIYLRKNKTMFLEVDIENPGINKKLEINEDHLHAEDLLKMVKDLPVGYRTVFNLYAIEGYSHGEIAEKLGISENTSKSQLSRARRLLQRKLLTAEQLKGSKNYQS